VAANATIQNHFGARRLAAAFPARSLPATAGLLRVP
jgi:hypothetical protein